MKNAMKKIMSLLLVAVLLVSAIPFQASAASESGFEEVIFMYDGENESKGNWTEYNSDGSIKGPATKTPQDFLDHYGMKEGYRFKEAVTKVNGDESTRKAYSLNETIYAESGMTVYIKLEKIAVYTIYVHYRTADGTDIGSPVEFTVKDGNALTWDAVNSKRNQSAAYDLDYFLADNQAFRKGASWTPKAGGDIIAYLTANGGGGNSGNNGGNDNTQTTKKITAVYSVDGANEVTKEYDVDHKYVWELIDMGGYDRNKVQLYKAGLGGSESGAKGIDDLIKRGQKIYIKMETKSSGSGNGGSTGTTSKYINFAVKINSSVDLEDSFKPADGKGSKVENILTNKWKENWKKNYKFENAWDSTAQKTLGLNDTVPVGHDVTIRVSRLNDNTSVGGDRKVDSDGNLHMGYSGKTNKDPYPVYLRVYLKNSGNGISYSKEYTITGLASRDEVLTLTEVRDFLKDYYKSTSSTDGFTVDGIYEYVSNFNSAWANDADKYGKIYNLDEARYDDTIRLAVVLNNAKLKTTSTNNSDNPKTGDMIPFAFTTMGLSATALAGLYLFNKKKLVK